MAASELHCECSAFSQLSQIRHCWAQPKLVICSKDVLGCSLACNSTIDDTIQQGVAPQAIVTVDAASSFTCHIETWNHTSLVLTLSVHSALQAPHAIVDHWRDDGHIKWLSGDFTAVNEVVVEFLATSCRATSIIPRFT